MEKLKNCKQVGCQVSEDGKCLEGLEIDDCPHFYWSEELQDIDETIEAPQNNPTSKQPTFQLFPGTELTLQQIDTVTNKYNCSWVVILGEFDCGKTTLLSSIFDLLQIGFFKKHLFAGSLTPIGFEERSHLSRTISGNEKPDTERTKSLGFRLLHLALKRLDSATIRNFILSDVSGETIRQARNSGSVMKSQLSLVKNADIIFYMFDGEKLRQEQRGATMLNANLFLDNAIKNGILDKNSVLNILISKWDMLFDDATFDLEKQIVQPLNSRFNHQLAVINYFKIAARPDESDKGIEIGFGLEDLLDKINTEMVNSLQKPEPILSMNSRKFEILKIKLDD